MKNHLRMGKRKPALTAPFHRVIKHIVNLHHAVMRKGAVGPWNILHCITAPADVAGTGAVLELTIGRSAPLIFHRGMVNGIVGTAGKFINIIGNLDGKAVVQVSGEYKYSLVQPVPEFD